MPRHLLSLSLALFVSLAAPSLSTANIYADNPPVILDRAAEPQFLAIGRLESHSEFVDADGDSGKALATGILVSPCYVLSDHHAFFGSDVRPIEGKDYSARFLVGIGTLDGHYAGAVTAVPVVWGDRDGVNTHDWALARLTSCVGKRPEIGWMTLYTKPSVPADLEHKKVALVSIPADTGVLSISFGYSTAWKNKNSTILHSASASPGSSGGAILIEDEGEIKLIGIHRGGGRDGEAISEYKFPEYRQDRANEFVPITEILDGQSVRDLLIADILRWNMGNPNGDRLRHGIPGFVAATPPRVPFGD